MAKLAFFDCNCSVGRVPYPLLMDISDVKGLHREMDTAGIEEALVFHTMARDASPPVGNILLHNEIDHVPGLHPVWVVLPHHTGEMAQPAKLIKDMEEKGVKAVRMYPTKDYHSFSLSAWNSGELLSALEEVRIPLMLDIEIVWWDTIHTILEKYPCLPVIATNVSYRHNRFTYPLLGKYENFYIETSRYFGAGTVEDVVKRFGARSILFGTNMPRHTGTAAVSMLTFADIPGEAKGAIAGENLRTLLEGVLS